jgi:hypothetical protein
MRLFETIEGKIVIVVAHNGVIIGKVIEGIMINPRMILTEETEQKGQVRIQFVKLFGEANTYFLPPGGFYVSENNELNALYEGATEPKSIIIA